MCLIVFVACWRDDTCAVHATMKVKCALQSFHSVSSLMLVGLVSATEPWTHHIQLERENPVRVSKQQETISIFTLQFNNDSKIPLHSTTQQTQQIWTFGLKSGASFPADMFWLFSKPQVQVPGKWLHDGRGWRRGCLLKDSDGRSCLGLFFMPPFAKHQDYAAETNIPDILLDI